LSPKETWDGDSDDEDDGADDEEEAILDELLAMEGEIQKELQDEEHRRAANQRKRLEQLQTHIESASPVPATQAADAQTRRRTEDAVQADCRCKTIEADEKRTKATEIGDAGNGPDIDPHSCFGGDFDGAAAVHAAEVAGTVVGGVT